jgi:hypothetical protein
MVLVLLIALELLIRVARLLSAARRERAAAGGT